jgi:hypothetical protein
MSNFTLELNPTSVGDKLFSAMQWQSEFAARR